MRVGLVPQGQREDQGKNALAPQITAPDGFRQLLDPETMKEPLTPADIMSGIEAISENAALADKLALTTSPDGFVKAFLTALDDLPKEAATLLAFTVSRSAMTADKVTGMNISDALGAALTARAGRERNAAQPKPVDPLSN